MSKLLGWLAKGYTWPQRLVYRLAWMAYKNEYDLED